MLGLTVGLLEQRPPEEPCLPCEPDRAQCPNLYQAARCNGVCTDIDMVLEGQEERAIVRVTLFLP